MKNITQVKGKRKFFRDVAGNLVPLAYPINSSRAQRKIKKIIAQQGCSYEEAQQIRMKRTGSF